jgi:8-oxo-dGTP diphosphatase
MLVLLVRHGHAGTKRHWRRDDRLRPLNEQGFAESEALADLLASFAPARIVSSPFLRCVQSVTPLSNASGIPVERSQSLVPEAGDAAKLLALGVSINGPGSVVLCTHGEVIHDVQTHLGREGPPFFGSDSLREKASVWVLDRLDGRFVHAVYLPPPQIEKSGTKVKGQSSRLHAVDPGE